MAASSSLAASAASRSGTSPRAYRSAFSAGASLPTTSFSASGKRSVWGCMSRVSTAHWAATAVVWGASGVSPRAAATWSS